MRLLATVLLAYGTLVAQVVSNRAAGGVVFTSPGGYGNVAFPGTGRPSVGRVPTATVPGRTAGVAGNGNGLRRNHASGLAYPVVVGGYGSDYEGYYDQSSGYGSQTQPNITIVNNPAPPPVAPTVVINQYLAPPLDPGVSEATHVFQPSSTYPSESAAADPTPPSPHYYLIAYKDHSVYSALAYWIEDQTLHYVTPQQTHNQASVDLIDMDFTKKLNQR